jgi:hypothetical protein
MTNAIRERKWKENVKESLSHKQKVGYLTSHATHTTEIDLESKNFGVIISSLS